MNNAELIDALRCESCMNDEHPKCESCEYGVLSFHGNHGDVYGCDARRIDNDAANAIEKLISRVPKWISVNERLPEESGGYLAYIQEPHMIQKADWEEQYDFSFVMQLWFDKQKMLWSDNGEDSYNAYLPVVDTDNAFHVTHWMKLPEPPKGE